MTTPVATSTIADDERERQQDADDAAGQVDPEVAQPVGRRADEAADQRDRHGHADRGRDEVLHGSPAICTMWPSVVSGT